MRILCYNWRDLRNPAGGGAEAYTHQIMKRLVAKGHEVTLFTSAFPDALREETVDGVRVVREGDRFSVYRRAKRFYRASKERYDVVIDEINTVPFMTPRFVDRGERLVVLIHQLAREFWYYEMPYPVAWMGYHYFERHWLRMYRGVRTITVSDSTRQELAALGFRDLHVVPNGLNVVPLDAVPEKSAEPSIVFVGRLKKAKKPEDALVAYRSLRSRTPTLHMTVVGDGYLRKKMQEAYPDVEFLGYVDKETRDAMVARSWAIAVPGVREGWGQVVTDSNALGTPAVGYDVPGLRDSIQDGVNGLLTRPTPEALAEGLRRVLSEPSLRAGLSTGALSWARRFDWDRSADEFERLLQ